MGQFKPIFLKIGHGLAQRAWSLTWSTYWSYATCCAWFLSASACWTKILVMLTKQHSMARGHVVILAVFFCYNRCKTPLGASFVIFLSPTPLLSPYLSPIPSGCIREKKKDGKGEGTCKEGEKWLRRGKGGSGWIRRTIQHRGCNW